MHKYTTRDKTKHNKIQPRRDKTKTKQDYKNIGDAKLFRLSLKILKFERLFNEFVNQY